MAGIPMNPCNYTKPHRRVHWKELREGRLGTPNGLQSDPNGPVVDMYAGAVAPPGRSASQMGVPMWAGAAGELAGGGGGVVPQSAGT